nr:hematopoietic cell signal transducer [Microcebus murinus]
MSRCSLFPTSSSFVEGEASRVRIAFLDDAVGCRLLSRGIQNPPELPRPGRSAGSCSACGPLSLPLLAGLVAADAVVSLLIVGAVFLCARLGHRPTQEDGRVYINMPGRG